MDIQGKAIIASDTSKAQKELDRLSKKSEELKRNMVAAQQANDKLSYDKFQKELRQTESEIRRAKRGIEQMNKAVLDLNTAPIRELQKEYRRLSLERANATRGTDDFDKLTLQMKTVKKTMDGVNESLKEQGNWLQRTNSKFTNAINQWGAAFTVATTVAIGFFMVLKKASEQAIEFEESFAKTKGLLSDAQRKDTKLVSGLEQSNIALIRKYGFAISDVNDALYESVSAGIEAGNSARFMTDVAELSVAGFSSLKTSVDGVSSVLNAYKYHTSEASKVANMFFTTQKLGKTTVSELAANVGELTPLTANLKIPFADVSAAIAAITVNGIKTSQAVTYLKAAINGLVKPTGEAKDILISFGLPTDAVQLKALGLGETLKRLSAAFKANEAQITRAIPSIEGYMAIASLTGENLSKYDEFLNILTTDIGKNSSMQKALNEQLKTKAGLLKGATGEMTAMAIELGNKLSPALVSVITFLTNLGKVITVVVYKISELWAAFDKLTANVPTWLKWLHEAFNPVHLFGFLDTINQIAKALEDLPVSETVKEFKALKDATDELLQTDISQMSKQQLDAFARQINQNSLELLEIHNNIINETASQINRLNDVLKNTTPGTSDYKEAVEKYMELKSLSDKLVSAQYGTSQADLEALLQKLNNVQDAINKAYATAKDDDKSNVVVAGKTTDLTQTKQQLKQLHDTVNQYAQQAYNDLLSDTARQIEVARQKYDTQIAIALAGEEDQTALSDYYRSERVRLEELKNQEIAQIQKNAHANELAELEKQRQEVEKKRQEVFEKYFALTTDEQMQRELDTLHFYYQQQLLTTEQYEQAAANIRKKYADLHLKTEQEKWSKYIEITNTAAERTMQIMSTINDVSEYFKNLELQRLDEVHDRQTQHNESISRQIEDQYARRQMSEEQYLNAKYAAETEQTRIETEQTEQRKQIEKKYAAFKLAETLASIYMDTSKAIMASVAASPLTGGLPWSAVVGTMGTVQAGIAIAKYATMEGAEDGGFIDVQRAQDGRKFRAKTRQQAGFVTQPSVLVGERGTEYVAPNEALLNPTIAPVLGIIEKARLQGTLKTLNLNRAITATGFERGGYTSKTIPQSTPGNSNNNATYDLLVATITELRNELRNLKAKVVYTDIDEVTNNMNEIRDKSKTSR